MLIDEVNTFNRCERGNIIPLHRVIT